MTEPTTNPKVPIGESVGVGEFADLAGLPVSKVIGELMKNGVMATINEQIDFDTAAIIGADLGVEVDKKIELEPERASAPEAGQGVARPPVVAVMGHVDHGKTSLLDAIRNTDVVAGESGGITQHIGAYQIKRKDRWITFLDTPGHEAFSAIRAHGARITDVAIVVVAADDGVKPQTKEAIKLIQDAGVQLVIAINKIDKPGADSNRVKQELGTLGLVPEEWGGKTVMIDISAKTGQGVEELLDVVLLVADIEEITTRAEGPSDGVVVESHLDSGKGPVATLLVENGLLKPGDFIVSGGTYAKVRNLGDFHGHKLKVATGGMPVQVTGFKALPAFGDLFYGVDSEKTAKEKSVTRQRADSIKSMVKAKIGVAELSSAITAGNVSELKVVVKADVRGTLSTLQESLANLRNDEVAVNIVSSGVGDVNESDISSAKASGALVIGFNVGVSSIVKQLADREKVKIQLYKVIYELLDDIRRVLSQMLKPEIIETVIGKLKILGVFKTTKSNVVCGGEVTEGKVESKVGVKIWRNKEQVGHGTLGSLQKEKQEAKQVGAGEQCGLNVQTETPILEGDVLEFFTTELRSRSL